MTAKVTPYDFHPPQKTENNFFDKGLNIIRQIKWFIILQAVLGINRLDLLECGTFIMRLSYLYTSCLFTICMSFLIVKDSPDKSIVIFKESTDVEYLLLIFISTFTYKETFKNFFKDLSDFDNALNISKEPITTIKVKTALFWMFMSMLTCLIEGIIIYVVYDFHFKMSIVVVYVTILAHDSEQIFFVSLMRTIKLRVEILKVHIAKSFNTDKDLDINEEFDKKIEEISSNVQLDTSAMHRAYELLHSCAEQLNAAMSFLMIVMLFTSGLTTTMMLKKFFQITQTPDEERDSTFNAILAFILTRCLKYTLLVIVPCYYATGTSKIVTSIRTILHSAVNTFRLDKIERRKIKAFFYLTQDNDFAYALWGVIRLSMSLPLSYASLCTTYLVIIIQFSKFID